MWLLESDLFEGKTRWLRPGKRYLFGRTAYEPGQIIITDKTVSRQHLSIAVEEVAEGDGRNLGSRPRVTVEDLHSKKGTLLNRVQIRGMTKTFTDDVSELKVGACPKTLRILWHPVVLSFSFTSKELRADPWATLRGQLEQLDIKFSSEFEPSTTHVVSKKRNTPKGLQALINGKHLVTDSFINAILEATSIPNGAAPDTPSPMEEDFTGCWPNAIEHLPPRGEEPSDRPPESYAPDQRRQEVFDGYTFVFYDKKQYENLFPVITHGKGKALLKEVTPNVTDVNDFVRYVKEVAGEKGLGSFQGGSEGKGVVVVRFTPAKGDDYEWFAQFFTSFAQRLDHRPIDQREFLDAILACDALMLRRPLQDESFPINSAAAGRSDYSSRMDVDKPGPNEQFAAASPPRRGRGRRAVSRFKGFELDSDDEDVIPVPPPVEEPVEEAAAEVAAASQDSLFVSQHPGFEFPEDGQEQHSSLVARRSQRKRAMSPLPEHDESAFLDGIAPTAAAAKRRRIDAGEGLIPPPREQDSAAVKKAEMSSPPSKKLQALKKGRSKKLLDGDEILEAARKRREEEEARIRAEQEDLARADDDIDYAAIRALHIVEECAVRAPREDAPGRNREQDIAEGRWDPRWNGRKNFKRFKKQGETGGRPLPRTIIALEEVRPNEYGIGDDYWLEDERSIRRKDSQPGSQGQMTQGDPVANKANASNAKAKAAARRTVFAVDSSDEEDDSNAMEEGTASPGRDAELQFEPPRSRVAKAAEREAARRAQRHSQPPSQPSTQSGRKRPAATQPGGERAGKRTRSRMQVMDSDGSGDDSDDELKFRFGRHRG